MKEQQKERHDLTLPQFHMAITAIGREAELQKLHPKLRESRQPVVITGIGGLGKTTLAQLYWQRHRQEYDCAAWLSANVFFSSGERQRLDNAEFFLRAFLDHPQLTTNLGLVFDPLQPPIEQFRQVITAIAGLEGEHLLVVDNVPEVAAHYLPELSSLQNWRILFTGRDSLPNTIRFELDTLSPDEAAVLFERIYENPAPLPDPDRAALAQLLHDIAYHTLTIELLAAYAREKKLDPPTLLNLLRQKGLTKLDDYDVTTVRFSQNRDIAAHLRELFWLELDPAEQEILRYCSILPTSNVPLDPDLVSEDRLCALFGQQDTEKDFKKLLRRLARLHWLVEKDGGYRCHPVIAETAKAQLKPDAVNCGVLIENIIRLLIPDKETNEPVIQRAVFVPFGEAVFQGAHSEEEKWEEAEEVLAALAVRLATVYRSLGEVFRALDYDRNAVTILEKVLPSDHFYLSVSYNNFALNYYTLGDYQKCIEYLTKAIVIKEKVPSIEYVDLALSYSNLAQAYCELGEDQKGLEYNLKALDIRKQILPPEHPELADSYNNLAMNYDNLGEFQKSLEYNQKGLAIREKVLPLEHPDLANSYNTLSMIYGNLGEYQKSLEYSQKALAIWEKVLPSKHLNLASSYNNIAQTYCDLGEYQKSLEYNQKALDIRKKVLPPEHPDFATTYNNIAQTYCDLGEHQKSLEYNQKALAIWEKILPSNHPNLASSYNNIAQTYGHLEEHQKSLEHHQKALNIRKKVLPCEHPSLANSYNNLALTYTNLGDYKKSLKYNQKALAILKKVLPLEHPHLALSYNNIAWNHHDLGDIAKAVSFMRWALAIFEKTLPPAHHYVINSRKILSTFEEKLKSSES